MSSTTITPATPTTTPNGYRLPENTTLQHAAKLAIVEDKPIMLDYWMASKEKKCCIGVKDNVKYLVKSETEYTSTIQNLYKIENCYIILTENSLYVVSIDIPIRKIVSAPGS